MLIIADENIPFVKESFGTLGDVVTMSGRNISASAIEKADALIVRSITKVNSGLIEKSHIKFVGTATIGTDHIDLPYLKEKGIAFASAPGSNANSVAEYITSVLLVLAKKNNFSLENKTIGIVGVGNVGSKVCIKAKTLGMKVLLNDPPLFRSTGDKKYLPIENLMNVDIITFHVPLTKNNIDATYHMINKDFLRQLKKGVILMNTSRGPVAQTSALKEALQNKILSDAIIDVWENEPSIDTELLSLVTIGTPHIAGYSYDGKVNGTYMVYKSLCQYLGKTPIWDTLSALVSKGELNIDNRNKNNQTVLLELVNKMYDILEDNDNLKKINTLAVTEQGKYFDKLRKEYRARREFSSIKVKLSKPDKNLEKIIIGLGFCMV
jgi:erythronate-4-phosphate dehydrogenase